MHRILLNLFLNFCSDNRQSKSSPADENLKWGGIVAIGVTFTLCGAVAQAQQSKEVPRIGFLSASARAANSARTEAFRQGLRELGHIEGENFLIEYGHAGRKFVKEVLEQRRK